MKSDPSTPPDAPTPRPSPIRWARVATGIPQGGEVDQRFFTKREMAGLLKVSLRTITEMMNRGDLAYLKIGGRLVRFRLEDVERRLNETALVCHGAAPGEGA